MLQMGIVAPNLAALIGDTVGARLISKAGSLTSLAKCPASTVQILGAEKVRSHVFVAHPTLRSISTLYHTSTMCTWKLFLFVLAQSCRQAVLYILTCLVSVCFDILQALFRALKTKGNTPKYGIIYHSTFIGRAAAKNKGRISRVLANKCAIASRIDR